MSFILNIGFSCTDSNQNQTVDLTNDLNKNVNSKKVEQINLNSKSSDITDSNDVKKEHKNNNVIKKEEYIATLLGNFQAIKTILDKAETLEEDDKKVLEGAKGILEELTLKPNTGGKDNTTALNEEQIKSIKEFVEEINKKLETKIVEKTDNEGWSTKKKFGVWGGGLALLLAIVIPFVLVVFKNDLFGGEDKEQNNEPGNNKKLPLSQ